MGRGQRIVLVVVLTLIGLGIASGMHLQTPGALVFAALVGVAAWLLTARLVSREE